MFKIIFFLLMNFNYSKVTYLIELFRHGARTSISHLENDPKFPSNYQVGSLTTTGMKQHFLLGQSIRKKYQDFFNNINYKQIKVLSSSSERCLISVQSQLMGLIGLENNNENIENDSSQFYNPPWILSKQFEGEKSLPEGLTINPLRNDNINKVFEPNYCKFDNVKNDFSNKIEKEYSKKFEVLYQRFEDYGYKLQDWFKDGDWSIYRANQICDWIYTKVYYFKDFQVDQEIFRLCKEFMTFDNFVRYMPQSVQRSGVYLLNQIVIKKLKEIQNGKNQDKMLILSGHDDNVSIFMQNFWLDNYKCIGDNFKLNGEECFRSIKFSSNILFEINEDDNGQKLISLFYNNQNFSYEDKTKFTIDEMIEILENDKNNDYFKYCQENKKLTETSKIISFIILFLFFINIILFWYLIHRRNKYKNQNLEENILDEDFQINQKN